MYVCMYIFINTASLKNRLHWNDNYTANLNWPVYYPTQFFLDAFRNASETVTRVILNGFG